MPMHTYIYIYISTSIAYAHPDFSREFFHVCELFWDLYSAWATAVLSCIERV